MHLQVWITIVKREIPIFEKETSRRTNETEKTAVILMGIPASGKSSFYAEQFAGNYIRINLDTLKTRNNEAALLQKCLHDRSSFVIDNTPG